MNVRDIYYMLVLAEDLYRGGLETYSHKIAILLAKQGLLIIVLFWSALAYMDICVLSCMISSAMELYTSCTGGGSALPRIVHLNGALVRCC